MNTNFLHVCAFCNSSNFTFLHLSLQLSLIKCVFQKLRGATEALYVLSKCNSTRFEFIFTNLVSINYDNLRSMTIRMKTLHGINGIFI